MKRNSLTKGLVVSVALSAFLTGCGSIDSLIEDATSNLTDDVVKKVEKQLSSISIKGRAVDGYLQDAKVCLDLNKDGYCQSSEPSSITDKDGSFQLNISPEVQKSEAFVEAMLLVYGGKDVDTGTDFRGKLLAPQDSENVVVTPITTLVAKSVQKELEKGKNLSEKEIQEKVQASKEQVAKVFGLTVEDLSKDPVAEKENNPKLIKETLKVQKTAEAMVGGIDDDAKIEEVYEKLAENLNKVEEDKGVDALLEKAYSDEIEKVNKAKEVNANIETAFKKLDADLEKIALITQRDLRKIKNNEDVKRADDDALFQDDVDWDREFIKADLENIGIENPSDEDIEKLKEQSDGEIKLGFLFEKKDDFKDSEDDFIKDIYIKVKKDEAKKEEKKEQEKAMKDSQNLKFEKGMTLYEFDSFYKGVDYTKIYLGEDDLIFLDEFSFKDGVFVEDAYKDSDDYILKDGDWIKEDKSKLNYSLDENGVINLLDSNVEVSLLSQKDISGKELFLDGIDDFVTMPEGSLVSYIGMNQVEDTYHLHDKKEGYSSITSYIEEQCSNGYYVNDDGSRCDADTTSGKIVYGLSSIPSKRVSSTYSWRVDTIDDVEMLVEANSWSKGKEETIYAVVDGDLYQGDVEKKGFEKEIFPNYNEVAINAIKKAITDSFVNDMPNREKDKEGDKKLIMIRR